MQNNTNIKLNLLGFPPELIIQIFTFLDIRSVHSSLCLCKKLYDIIDMNLWKRLFLRDHFYFLTDEPISEYELKMPEKEEDIKTKNITQDEASQNFTYPFETPLKLLQNEISRSRIQNIQDWKELYRSFSSKLNLNGEWKGYYGAAKEESLILYHKGYKVYAKKTTGYTNVPADKLSWRMNLDKNMRRGKGEIHFSEPNYQNPKWRTAYLEVVNENLILIAWFGKTITNQWVKITFSIVRCTNEPVAGMSVKIEPLKFSLN